MQMSLSSYEDFWKKFIILGYIYGNSLLNTYFEPGMLYISYFSQH